MLSSFRRRALERAAVNPSDHLRDAALHLVFIERKSLSTGSRVMQGGQSIEGGGGRLIIISLQFNQMLTILTTDPSPGDVGRKVEVC
jgi:hypothetical protein